MTKPKERMAFYDVGKGKFKVEMQEEFERAQRIAHETGCEVTLTSSITIVPPSTQEERFGGIIFKMKVVRPQIKSQPYTTELVDGKIVADGDSQGDLLQLNLDLKAPEVGGEKEVATDGE